MINWLGQICQDHITLDDTVLDLGCGIQQANDDIKAKSVLGVDLWDVYLNHIKNNIPTCRINMSETDRFMDKSYDVVLCLDVVEHLEFDLATHIIDECKRIARRTAIIYTPMVFKDNMEAVENSWNLGFNEHQKHLCVLEKSDFHVKGYHVDKPNGNGLLAIWN